MPWSIDAKTTFTRMYNNLSTSKDKAKLVQGVEVMITLLLGCGLAYMLEIPPKLMGVHPSNRGGKGMVAQACHRKCYKIVTVGFSFTKCTPDRAVGFEDNPVTRIIDIHTQKMCASSKGFADLSEGVRFGSVGCGHLNQFLAATTDCVETDEAGLCEVGSTTIARDMLTSKDTQLKLAVTNGLKWTIVKHEVDAEFPLFPSLVAKALNVEHHVGEGHIDSYVTVHD